MFRCPQTQIIGMSATLGNMNEIIQFLNAQLYCNNFRPVELTEHVKIDDSVYTINPKPLTEQDLFTFTRKVSYPKGDGGFNVLAFVFVMWGTEAKSCF